MVAHTDATRQIRFLCDAMLGTLCRWLRFFGYDAEYGGVRMADSEMLARAADERRWLLTRDRDLASIGVRTTLVRSTGLEDQLVEVLARLQLRPAPNLDHSRCASCNGELGEADREAVAGIVPPYTLSTARRFRRCRGCGRVYWPGTHGDRINARLRRVISRLGADEADDANLTEL